MTRFSPASLDRLRAAINLPELVGQYVKLRNNVGLCPFHSEKTPSFRVYANNHWYCYGCKLSGDGIRFLMRVDGLTFRAAATTLAERYGVSLADEPIDVEAMKRARTLAKEEAAMAKWWWDRMLARGTPDDCDRFDALSVETTLALFRWARNPALEREYAEHLAWREMIREAFVASAQGARSVAAAWDAAVERRGGPLVILNLDADEAGLQGTIKAAENALAEGCRVRVLRLPCDPDEYVAKYGAESYREACDLAMPYLTWIVAGCPTLHPVQAPGTVVAAVAERVE